MKYVEQRTFVEECDAYAVEGSTNVRHTIKQGHAKGGVLT